jgi:hypothetical protein
VLLKNNQCQGVTSFLFSHIDGVLTCSAVLASLPHGHRPSLPPFVGYWYVRHTEHRSAISSEERVDATSPCWYPDRSARRGIARTRRLQKPDRRDENDATGGEMRVKAPSSQASPRVSPPFPNAYTDHATNAVVTHVPSHHASTRCVGLAPLASSNALWSPATRFCRVFFSGSANPGAAFWRQLRIAPRVPFTHSLTRG